MSATNPTPCERCGQGDCPTLLWRNDEEPTEVNQDEGWTAAFQACGTMRGAVATQSLWNALDRIGDLLVDIRDNMPDGPR